MAHQHSGEPLDMVGKFAQAVFIKAKPLEFAKFATVGHRLAEAYERILAGEGDLTWPEFMSTFCPDIPMSRADQLVAAHLGKTVWEVRKARVDGERQRAQTRQQDPLDVLAKAAHDEIKEAERHQKEADRHQAEADERFAAAGRKLKEAKDRLQAGEMAMTWAEFLLKYCPISKSRAYELIAIAEGRTTAEEVREKVRARKQAHRARKQQQTDVRSGNGHSEAAGEEEGVAAGIRKLIEEVRLLDNLDDIRRVEDVLAEIRSGRADVKQAA